LEPYYKNPSVIEQIKLNLKLLKEKFNLSSLNLKINRLSKVINNEAKNIYDNLKQNNNYP
jgi:hypothetical protein